MGRVRDSGNGRPWSAEEVARAGTSFDWLTGSPGALHWVASVPTLDRSVHQTWLAGARKVISRESPAMDVGSGLHAYGGPPYAVGPGSARWLVNAADDQVWDGVGRQLTRTSHVYGDLYRSDGELLCVREDDDGDEIVVVDTSGRGPRVLHRTNGFLATPRRGHGHLAWVQWGREVMPWDSSEVWMAGHELGGQLIAPRRVAGGPTESALQPEWGEDGCLYLMSDRTGWWNLYRCHDGQVAVVAGMDADCATAPWESSYTNYALLPDGRIAMTVHNGPHHGLVVVDAGGATTPIELPYTSIKPYLAAAGDRVALIGSSPTRGQEIALVATDGSHNVDVVHVGGEPPTLSELSVPEVLAVDSAGSEVTVLYYPPTRPAGPAPLIVRPHAGPTYHSEYRLDLQVQFFTSRGFAVADVDYRGSTGYGRAFRKALDGNWGRFDVQDCREVAVHLLATGRAQAGAVFISGASAGGYTALRAVCQDGPFALAVARSAIVDPKRWTTTAPRFQRPHAAILSHDGARVQPHRLRRPVVLIHGVQDRVAPIHDVTELASAAAERGLLVGMLRIDGVGHDLPAAALVTALEAELDAYRVVVSRVAESAS